MSKITTGTLEPGIGEDNTIKVAGDLAVAGSAEVQGNISIDGTMEQAALPMFACRAWVKFNGSTTPPTILAGGNIASVTRPSTGSYTITFVTPMPDAHYAITGLSQVVSTGNPNDMWIATSPVPTATAFTVATGSGANSSLTTYNSTIVTVAVFR